MFSGFAPPEKVRDTTYAEDQNTGYTANGPQVMATLRNIAISLLHLADVTGITEITRTLQRITRDRTRACCSSPYETQVTTTLPIPCRPGGKKNIV